MLHETIGIYIHIPFCIKKCNIATSRHFLAWMTALRIIPMQCAGIEKAASDHSNKLADSVFFWRRDPSVLPARYISKIIDALSKGFKISKMQRYQSKLTLERYHRKR